MRPKQQLAKFVALAGILIVLALAIHQFLGRGGQEQGAALGKSAEAGAAPLAEHERAPEVPTPAPEAFVDAQASEPDAGAGRRVVEEGPAEQVGIRGFDATDAPRLAVRVDYPPGTPVREQASVVLITSRGEHAVDLGDQLESWRERGRTVPSDLIEWSSERLSGGSGLAWARAELDADHRASLPYPADASTLFLSLEAEHLFLEEPVQLEPSALPSEATLQPLLGAAIAGRCILPADCARREVDPAQVKGRVELFTLEPVEVGGGRSFFHRSLDLQPDGSFLAGGLPPGLRVNLGAQVENLSAVQPFVSVELVAGQTHSAEFSFALGGALRGRVIDSAGAAVPGATVTASERRANMMGGGGWHNAQTDEEGRFNLLGLGASGIRVSCNATGFVEYSGELELVESQELEGYEIRLERGLSIAGRVLKPDGSPAGGARIAASQRMQAGRNSWKNEVGSTTAEDDGGFAISGLAADPHELEASFSAQASEGEGFKASYRARLEGIQAGAKDVVVRLEPTHRIQGRVLTSDEKPVTSFSLRVTEQVSGGEGDSRLQAFESEEGRFDVNGLLSGSYRVGVEAEGYQDSEEDRIVGVPQPEAELLLRLLPSASIAGRVVDPFGAPVAEAKVGPVDTERNGRVFAFGGGNEGEVRTDAQGRFVLEDLALGTLAIEATSKEWARSEPVTVELRAGERTSDVVVTMRQGGRIVGDAFDETGGPLVGRTVALGMGMMMMMGQADDTAKTDGAGHFVLEHIDPGRHTVTIGPSTDEILALATQAQDEAAMLGLMSKILSESVTVEDGQEVYVRLGAEPLRPVRVHGRVTEAGQPLPKGTLFVITEGKVIFQGMKMAQIEEGRYEVTVDRPGAYVFGVQTEGPGNAPLEFRVEVPEAESFAQDLSVPLGKIRGRVFGPEGRGVPNVMLQITREDGAFSLTLDVDSPHFSDSEGGYELTHLHPGTYVVRAGGGAGDGATAEYGVEVRGGLRVEEDASVEGVDFHLQSGGKVAGMVRDRDGNPVGGVALFVRNAAGELLAKTTSVRSAADGKFVYSGVPAGSVTVSARGEGVAAGESKAVAVRSGQTSEVDLVVEPATMLSVSVEDEEGKTLRSTIRVLDEGDREVGGMFQPDGGERMLMEGIDSKRTRIGPLPPGKYKVHATATDGRTNWKSVSLSGKEERSLRIKIRD